MTIRVTALNYAVDIDEGSSFEPTARTEVTLGDFECVLEDLRLVARPLVDYTEPNDARAAIEPFLEGWSVKSEVIDGVPMRFRFDGSTATEDGPDGAQNHAVAVVDTITVTTSVTGHVMRTAYPAPDARWREESSLGVDLRTRWRNRRATGGALSPVAYRMITAIRHEYGSNKDVAARFRVSRNVIDEVSALAGADIERKVVKGSRELTAAERQWLTNAMTALVRRVHEVDAGVDDLQELTKDEFN